MGMQPLKKDKGGKGKFRKAHTVCFSEQKNPKKKRRSLQDTIQSTKSEPTAAGLTRTLTETLRSKEHNQIRHKDVDMVKMIGQGAFGSVYEGRHKPTGRKLAVKQVWLGGKAGGGARLLQSAQREIHLLSKLDHINIVKYLGSCREGENFFMYLELVKNGSLEDKMYPRNGYGKKLCKLSLAKAQDFGKQILEGLSYLHENSVVHRDLKPGNVLIGKGNELKLADFGASFDMDAMTMKRNQTTVGTPHYMAPEVVIRGKHNTASDLWSFGVMMFEMVTGKLPFESKSAPQLMLKLAQGKVEIEWPRGMLPDHFRGMVVKCLRADPATRPSAKRLLNHGFFQQEISAMSMTQSSRNMLTMPGLKEEDETALYTCEGMESMLMTEYSCGPTMRK